MTAHRTGVPEPPKLQAVRRILPKRLIAFAAIAVAVLCFRFQLRPLIEGVFHPGVALTTLLRRAGTLASALLGYGAYVRWHEKRPVTN